MMAVWTQFIVLLFILSIPGRLSKPYGNVCSLPKKTGPCRAAFKRYYFDIKSGLCQDFTYGGCRGNGNNFKTMEECRKTCGCKAPAKTGNCKARILRYYFDQKKRSCIQFVYGGCDPNENNFKTKQACMQTCM